MKFKKFIKRANKLITQFEAIDTVLTFGKWESDWAQVRSLKDPHFVIHYTKKETLDPQTNDGTSVSTESIQEATNLLYAKRKKIQKLCKFLVKLEGKPTLFINEWTKPKVLMVACHCYKPEQIDNPAIKQRIINIENDYLINIEKDK